jgi:membrane protease YdiL (CAAX protease family)
MSSPTIATPAVGLRAGADEEVDRYAGIRQYSLTKIFAVWAAAALPMAVLCWLVAPALKDHLSGAGNVPLFKALNICLTVGLVWEFVLVVALVWREQRTFRWSTIREALWLRSPRNPSTGRTGGRIWLIVIPLVLATFVESLIPLGGPKGRDFGAFIGSDVGKAFLQGAWGWYALMLVWFVFNTVIGEELLFRGLLLPRMNGVFKRKDWLANGVFFAAYHLHMPWVIPGTLLVDTFAIAYPAKRYRSALIAIAVHSAQSVFFAVLLLTLVL